VQPDRLQHRVRQHRPQKRQREVLVQVVDSPFGRCFTLHIQQMPKVMQERGRHQFVGSACFFGQGATLQCMLKLRHRLAAIREATVLLEQRTDIVQTQCHSLTPTVMKRSPGW
jgi:hypothetical protein